MFTLSAADRRTVADVLIRIAIAVERGELETGTPRARRFCDQLTGALVALDTDGGVIYPRSRR